MIFFTSDTHWWHSRIIGYSKRPFRNIHHMHDEMIKRWNQVVGPQDLVYHLGDMTFAGEGNTMAIMYQLNGKIARIRGNHDKKMWVRPGIDTVLGDYAEIAYKNQKIVLCHYPLATWNKAHRGSWMLHGHCHGSYDYRNRATTRLDVGVDGEFSAYQPLSFDEVALIMRDKDYEIVDNHGRKDHDEGEEE